MTGANEVLGYPRKYFLFVRKLSDDLFYQLSNFRTIRSLDAPSRAASCPCNDIFLFIFCHLPTFFLTKTGPLDAPQGGCPGPSHRPHPLCTPLRQLSLFLHVHCPSHLSLRCRLSLSELFGYLMLVCCCPLRLKDLS